MNDPNAAFTQNTFVDKLMKLIPEDPLSQAQYIYFLTVFVFLGLLGYGVMSWFTFFTTWSFASGFQGVFMTAIALISLFGLKQTRNAYHMMKKVYSNKDTGVQVESVDAMLNQFDPVSEVKDEKPSA